MNISIYMIWVILGCALVTIIPRILPFMFVKRIQLPEIILKWLSFIPVCILTALIVENVIIKTDSSLIIDWQIFIALIPTTIIALLTRNLSITVIIGIASIAIIRYIG